MPDFLWNFNFKKVEFECKIPIKEIILGASCKIKEDDVYHFLSFHGYDAGNINILKSKSSYDGY